jgi:hypothetical protein
MLESSLEKGVLGLQYFLMARYLKHIVICLAVHNASREACSLGVIVRAASLTIIPPSKFPCAAKAVCASIGLYVIGIDAIVVRVTPMRRDIEYTVEMNRVRPNAIGPRVVNIALERGESRSTVVLSGDIDIWSRPIPPSLHRPTWCQSNWICSIARS